MELPEIKALRDKCEAEIQELLKNRAEIDGRIVGLRTMVKGLNYMENGSLRGSQSEWELESVPLPPGYESLHSLGLTEAIRLILTESLGPLTARQIRDRLLAFGYKKLPADNPMAAVHGVLRRLVVTGDVIDSDREGGRTAYRMLTEMDKVMRSTANAMKRVLGPPSSRIGTDPKLNSAYESGMRGDEKPKQSFGGPPVADVPNPSGKTLSDMLKETKKK